MSKILKALLIRGYNIFCAISSSLVFLLLPLFGDDLFSYYKIILETYFDAIGLTPFPLSGSYSYQSLTPFSLTYLFWWSFHQIVMSISSLVWNWSLVNYFSRILSIFTHLYVALDIIFCKVTHGKRSQIHYKFEHFIIYLRKYVFPYNI